VCVDASGVGHALEVQSRDIGQAFANQLDVAGAAGVLFGQAFELREEDGGLPGGDPDICTQRVVAEPALAFAAALVENFVGAVNDGLIVRKQDPAFARGHDLAVLKTEGADDADAAGAHAVPFRAVGVRRVFENGKSVRGGDSHDGIHVGHRTAEVDGDDGARLLRDGLADAAGIDVKRVRLNIDENRGGAHAGDGGGCRDERNGGDDNLIAFADTEGF